MRKPCLRGEQSTSSAPTPHPRRLHGAYVDGRVRFGRYAGSHNRHRRGERVWRVGSHSASQARVVVATMGTIGVVVIVSAKAAEKEAEKGDFRLFLPRAVLASIQP